MIGNNHKLLCMTSSDVFSLPFGLILHDRSHSILIFGGFWGFLLGLDSGLVLDVIKKTKAAVMPGGFTAAAVSRQINIYPQPQNRDVVI